MFSKKHQLPYGYFEPRTVDDWIKENAVGLIDFDF